MKKIAYLIVLLGTLVPKVNAQGFKGDTGCDCFTKKGNGKFSWYIGLHAGYFLQQYDKDITDNADLGAPYGGLFAGVHLTSYLSVQTGISYSYSANVNNHLNSTVDLPLSETVTMHYAEVPIEFQLRLLVYKGWMVFLQPGVFNNITFLKTYSDDSGIAPNKDITYNRLYGGGGLGAGYALGSRMYLSLQADFHTLLVGTDYFQPDYRQRFGARLGLMYTFKHSK